MKTKIAIIGSGNIGSDLMMKVIRLSETREMGAMVGIDPSSDGLARAKRLGYATTAEGVQGLLELPVFAGSAEPARPPRDMSGPSCAVGRITPGYCRPVPVPADSMRSMALVASRSDSVISAERASIRRLGPPMARQARTPWSPVICAATALRSGKVSPWL